ncbi:MAG: hypothetical protein EAZ42_02030 [Verrucomicrobia bacterium]|nr:MAG: hypothetical protein EAZ42_02030 [Verrucomicrobiota bacterium]
MNADTKEILTDAVRYWEIRRIAYNLFLLLVSVATHLSLVEEHRQKITIGSLAGLLILAVLANLLYSAAYIPDVVAQFTAYRQTWKKLRVGLFIFGTLFAGVLTFLCVAPLRFE